MELKNYSIKSVALGTKDLSQMANDFLLKSYDYLETSISYNNDFLLGKYLNKKTKVISEISSLSEHEIFLRYHLKWLNRKKIDILLVNSKGSWVNEDLLRLKENTSFYSELGISNVESIEEVERFLNLGVKPSWVSITLNPTYFNIELLEYLKGNDIKIIAHSILGGEQMARMNIEVYTLQFLLEFAALYADIVCISGHSMEESIISKTHLEKFIGQFISDETKGLYLFPSSRIVKRAPVKTLPLYRYLAYEDLVVKFNGPKEIILPVLSMDKELEKINEPSEELMTKLEKTVYDGLNKIILPEDCIPGSGEAEAFWRYSVIAILSTIPAEFLRYKYTYEKQGNLFLILREKRFGIKKNNVGLFLLVSSEKMGIPVFKQIKNNEKL